MRDPLRGRWGWYSLPGTIVLGLVFGFPIAYLCVNSFFRHAGLGQVEPDFTLANYSKFLTDWFYLSILADTFLLGAIVVSACVVLAYPVAYFLARTRSRWRGVLIFLVVAPLLISVVIRNLGWLPLLGSNGLVNWFLLTFGIVEEPLKLIHNFTGVAIGLTHSVLPFMILTLTTVIQRIDPTIEEAALNLGASPWQTFWRVVFPLSRPGLLGGYLLVFTLTISAFTTPALMGGKRVMVMATYIEQQVRFVLNYAFGATTAVILMIAAIALTIIAASWEER